MTDVKNKCLFLGSVSDAFVAVNYRYGELSSIAMDTTTFEKMQKMDALDTLDSEKPLSPIVRHGIYLTSILGERYL